MVLLRGCFQPVVDLEGQTATGAPEQSNETTPLLGAGNGPTTASQSPSAGSDAPAASSRE